MTPAPPAPSATPAEGGTLRYAISEPESILPGAVTEPDDLVVADTLFDSLTTYGSDLSVLPAAAVRWEAEADARSWTFHLREGARFHDGTPVYARHFKDAWDLAAAGGPGGYHLEPVVGYDEVRTDDTSGLRGVTVVGPRETSLVLRVRLKHPLADFPAVVAHPALGPLPDAGLVDAGAAYAEQPVGNGPFRMTEPWAHDRFIRVRRFPEWRNGSEPAAVREVLFQITDPDTAYLAFQQDRLDFTVLPAGALQDATGRYGRSPDGYSGPGVLDGHVPAVYFLGVDHRKAPFDRLAVRRALSLAIDRLAVVARQTDPNVAAARHLVPPAVPEGDPGVCDVCRHDPVTARAVFAQEEVAQLELWFNAGAGHGAVAETVRSNVAAAGVEVVPRRVPSGEYFERLRTGDGTLFRFGWAPDYPTLDAVLHPLLHSSATPEASGGFNYGRYANPQVDQLLDRARATLDRSRRAELYRQAEAVALNTDVALIPIMTYRHRAVVSARVEGFRLNPMGRPNLEQVRLRAVAP